MTVRGSHGAEHAAALEYVPDVSTADETPDLITDPDRLEALCDELVGEEFYAVDTEFHTERTYWPQLALIQFGWREKVALVDPLAVDPAPLGRLFAGPGTAVAHAAGQDVDILHTACGAAPSSVFDTQIAAGFLGMSTPSLARLVDQVLGISLPKTDQLSDWLHRPIPPSQLTYAAGDVVHLLALRSTMVAELEARGRLTWALEECALALPGQRRDVVPEQAWWKVGDLRTLSGRAMTMLAPSREASAGLGLGATTANILIGILSAIVDNIPVMFAVLSMNPDMDLYQWLLVTLTAGVGGTMLSVGSAAGVALMGTSRGMYTFFSHLKWSWAIALGYAASIFTHYLINH